MKTLFTPKLFFFLCLLAFTARRCSANDVVYDTNGDPVTNGGQYRILGDTKSLNPSFFRFYPECLFSLTLQPPSNSLPVTITTPYDDASSSSTVSTTSPLSLSYANHPNAACTNLTLEWFVLGESLSFAYVLVGHKQDYFVPDAVREGWFFLKTSPSSANNAYAYALVFCTDREGTACTNLRLQLDAWSRSVILVTDQASSTPFLVRIQREASTSGISMVV